MRSPDKGFAAAGTFLKMEPNDREPGFGFKCFNDLADSAGF
jgi:hypothetical protein